MSIKFYRETIEKTVDDAEAAIGGEVFFSYVSGNLYRYGEKRRWQVSHWLRAEGAMHSTHNTIASGSFNECVEALRDYVENYRRPPTQEEIGMTLGVIPERSMASAAE